MAGSVNKYTAFFQKVDCSNFDPAPCWAWTGAGKGNGYGQATHEGVSMGAHRKAFLLLCGPITDGMDVCHSCDNRWCVNPNHLYLGSRQQNMDDCVARGRAIGGRRKHLKEGHVQEIRRRLLAGGSAREISEHLNVHYGTVTAIGAGRSYLGGK